MAAPYLPPRLEADKKKACVAGFFIFLPNTLPTIN